MTKVEHLDKPGLGHWLSSRGMQVSNELTVTCVRGSKLMHMASLCIHAQQPADI